jgi:PTH1 family peptidyl-tRNA hydrolase
LKSIEAVLQSQTYARLRVGIGPLPSGEPWEDFVLAPFSEPERTQLEELMPQMLDAVDGWVRRA